MRGIAPPDLNGVKRRTLHEFRDSLILPRPDMALNPEKQRPRLR